MGIKCKKLLRPIFNMVANIGIGLPHAGYETKLMMAGVKPCLITVWPLTADKGGEDYTKLQPLIDSGQIVVAGIEETSFPHHIICRPEDVEAVKKYAPIAAKLENNEPMSDEELEYEKIFWRDYYGIQFENGRPLLDQYNQRSQTTPFEYQRLLEGKARVTLPIMTGVNHSLFDMPIEIHDKLKSGELYAIYTHQDIRAQAVLAQRDCLDMGKELFARRFKNGTGYPALSDKDDAKRQGELFGYTNADIDFFLGPGTKPISQHSLADRIQITLFPLLRKIRAETMIYDANQPK